MSSNTSEKKVTKAVCIFIPTLTAGGAERVASILANCWSKTHRVVVVTYFDEEKFFKPQANVEVRCLGMAVSRNTIQRATDVLKAVVAFRRLLIEINPAFVLSFMNKYNAFCLMSLVGAKIPVVISERGSPTESLPKVRVLARDLTYPYASGLICQTSESRKYFSNILPAHRIVDIPNPVAPIVSSGELSFEKTVLAVGRLVEDKAMDQLIIAFARMKTKGWSLVVCGDGPMLGELQKLVSELNIRDRVRFMGLISDLRPYYRKAGIFAFSSLHEGFPNALAEAVVSGLPCVSYDCPTGPADLIENNVDGVLVPVGDIEMLSEGLDKLACNSAFARKLGEAAAKRSEDLAPARIASEYLTNCEKWARG